MAEKIGTCKVDGQMFTYTAPSWRGKCRTTCDKHRAEIKRSQTADRVRRHRMNKDPKGAQFITVHIQSCGQRSYCGRRWTDADAQAVSRAILSGNVKGRLCKTCIKRFDADMGGGK